MITSFARQLSNSRLAIDVVLLVSMAFSFALLIYADTPVLGVSAHPLWLSLALISVGAIGIVLTVIQIRRSPLVSKTGDRWYTAALLLFIWAALVGGSLWLLA